MYWSSCSCIFYISVRPYFPSHVYWSLLLLILHTLRQKLPSSFPPMLILLVYENININSGSRSWIWFLFHDNCVWFDHHFPVLVPDLTNPRSVATMTTFLAWRRVLSSFWYVPVTPPRTPNPPHLCCQYPCHKSVISNAGSLLSYNFVAPWYWLMITEGIYIGNAIVVFPFLMRFLCDKISYDTGKW